MGVVSRLLASIVTLSTQVLQKMEAELNDPDGNPLNLSFMNDLPDPEMEAEIREEFLAPLPFHVRVMTRWLSRRRKRPQKLSLVGRVLLRSATAQATTAMLALIFAVVGMVWAVSSLNFSAASFPAVHQ
jgi:hypothetical protein